MDATIQIFDLKRMLVGDEPLLFVLEIVVRTVVFCTYTLVMLRWLPGDRPIVDRGILDRDCYGFGFEEPSMSTARLPPSMKMSGLFAMLPA